MEDKLVFTLKVHEPQERAQKRWVSPAPIWLPVLNTRMDVGSNNSSQVAGMDIGSAMVQFAD